MERNIYSQHSSLEYWLSDKREDVEIHALHAFLKGSYWAKGIPLEIVKRSVEGSMNFSVHSNSEGQVGFARVITDFSTFGYLGDVYILETHRGLGLAKWLLGEVFAHPHLRSLRRWCLITKDMHPLYEPFEFRELKSTGIYMERVIQNPYKS